MSAVGRKFSEEKDLEGGGTVWRPLKSLPVRHPDSVINTVTRNFRFTRRFVLVVGFCRWLIRVALKIRLVTMFPLELFSAPSNNRDTSMGYVSTDRNE